LNSCLYKAKVMHHRLAPRKHHFHYSVFLFYIDLDELDFLKKKLLFFGHNRFNLFNFKDSEHLQLPMDRPDKSKSTRQHITDYLVMNGVTQLPERIMLLTNLNVLGYNFNPVSFYYCFDSDNQPLYCIAEVSNTFREMKPYFLGPETFKDGVFHLNTAKYFYVSPFMAHDLLFDFRLPVPEKKLNIRIDDFKDKERVFISSLTGIQKPLTNGNMALFFLRFPLLTLRIMGLIHWQAFLLWRKKISYHKKTENKNLQRDVYRKYKE
jgi:DUF1365 family protein